MKFDEILVYSEISQNFAARISWNFTSEIAMQNFVPRIGNIFYS
jgi:hypothetical protein